MSVPIFIHTLCHVTLRMSCDLQNVKKCFHCTDAKNAIFQNDQTPHTSFKTDSDTFPFSLFSIPSINLCNFKMNVNAPSEKT